MPFMDDQQFMDDLFGDSEPVNVHVPSNPSVKGLSQRLEDLYASGCCQKIAWSKTGCVASISTDARSINVQVFRRSPKSKEWGLGPKAAVQLPSLTGEPLHFTHITWSHFGVDLVAIDRFGRILVWGTYTGALGRMMQMPVQIKEPEDASFAVVGLHWLPVLPTMSKALFIWSANRTNEQASPEFSYSQHVITSPANQNEGKPAFFCLTRNGALRLYWQQHNGPWREFVQDLGSFMQSGQAFTHASFCAETDRSLILAAYNELGSLFIYRVEIAWKQIQEEHGQQRYAPMVKTSPLFVEENFGPNTANDASAQEIIDLPYQLSHLKILSSTTTRPSPQTFPITILAAFVVTTPPLPLGLDHIQPSSSSGTNYTVLTFFEIQRKTLGLSIGFDKFSTKSKSTNSVQTRESRHLVRQNSVAMPTVVLSIDVLRYNTLLAFVMGDGSVDFRDRDALDTSTQFVGMNGTVGNLPSAGFGFPTLQLHPYIALSPNYCMLACMDGAGKITLSKMENVVGAIENNSFSPEAITGLVIHNGSASSVGWQVTDDILAIFPSNFNRASIYEFFELSCDALKVSLDFTSLTPNQHAPAALWSSPTIHRLWGFQSILGTNNKGERDISGRLAWTSLNMRAILLTLFRSLKNNEAIAPEVARSLISPITWVQDLITLVVDELIDIWTQTKDIVDDIAKLKAKFTEDPPTWIILILSSGPRHLLRLLYRQIISADGQVRTALKTTPQSAQERFYALTSFLLSLQNCPVRPKTIESLVFELEHAIRVEAYDAAGVTPPQRAQHERRMLIRGEIPDILYPAVQKLLKEIIPKRIQEIDDMAAVRMRDIRLLGLTADKRTKKWHEEHVVDVMRRAELPKGTKLRRCTRCNSAIEDPDRQQAQPEWLITARKQCICAGPWYLDESNPAPTLNGTARGS